MEHRVSLDSKPSATALTVEGLVALVKKGRVRVPTFQRGLRWESSDVLLLFDSIFRGYPIGSLLFLKRPAQAERIEMGPLVIDAREEPEAWWVVDGQQRLTALAASLMRPDPFPQRPVDPYAVYFDARTSSFEKPPKAGELPSPWVPAPLLLDSSRLAEWVFGWEHREDEDLRRAVFEAGKRVREYSVPLYVIETADEDVPKQIFDRVNNAGKQIEWTDVHKALFGSSGTHPSSLEDLAEELTQVGMGRPGKKRLLRCIVALRGLDVTRKPDEHFRKRPQQLEGAVRDAVPVLRRVLSFLKHDARIPHLQLLPEPSLLDVLTRFFHLFPEPSQRVRTLLVRWLWRIFFGAEQVARATLRRRGIGEISEHDEEEAVQDLLELVSRTQPAYHSFPDRFDARTAHSRIVLLAICSRAPRHLGTGAPIEISKLVERESDRTKGIQTFFEVKEAGETARGAANRTLHPRMGSLSKAVLERLDRRGYDKVIESHCIDSTAAEALQDHDVESFLLRRREILIDETQRLGQRLAAWGQNDRPSIEHLLAQAS